MIFFTYRLTFEIYSVGIARVVTDQIQIYGISFI